MTAHQIQGVTCAHVCLCHANIKPYFCNNWSKTFKHFTHAHL